MKIYVAFSSRLANDIQSLNAQTARSRRAVDGPLGIFLLIPRTDLRKRDISPYDIQEPEGVRSQTSSRVCRQRTRLRVEHPPRCSTTDPNSASYAGLKPTRWRRGSPNLRAARDPFGLRRRSEITLIRIFLRFRRGEVSN